MKRDLRGLTAHKDYKVYRNTTHWITFQNKTLCMRDWADELNMNYTTLSRRLNQFNWSIEKALTTPVQKKGKR